MSGKETHVLLKNYVFLSTDILLLQALRQVLFDVLAGNPNLAKSLNEKSNHAMYPR